jgi:hypothetical protein
MIATSPYMRRVISMERRASQRCPVCQGPALPDPAAPDGVRCRRSTCAHNHADVACPRCKKRDLESVEFTKDSWHYTCRECLNKWTIAATAAT